MFDMPKRLQIGATTAVMASNEIVSDLAPFIYFESPARRAVTMLDEDGVEVAEAPSMI